MNPMIPYLTGWLNACCLPPLKGTYLRIVDVEPQAPDGFVVVFASGAKLQVKVTEIADPPAGDKDF
jgi:hypothetical protein